VKKNGKEGKGKGVEVRGPVRETEIIFKWRK
jgi:hypothetical protein